jgi:hypothetical protein
MVGCQAGVSSLISLIGRALQPAGEMSIRHRRLQPVQTNVRRWSTIKEVADMVGSRGVGHPVSDPDIHRFVGTILLIECIVAGVGWMFS